MCTFYDKSVTFFYDLLYVKWNVLLRVSMVTETPPEWLMDVLVIY